MILAGTGHRPSRLQIGYDRDSNKLLRAFLFEKLTEFQNKEAVDHIIVGMATGFDQAFGEAAVEAGIPFTAAVPFFGMESKWPESGQQRFFDLLGKAAKVHTVCEPGYDPAKFIARDHWMVDNANAVFALFSGEEKGGTWQTVKYARSKSIPVYSLWVSWLAFKERAQK